MLPSKRKGLFSTRISLTCLQHRTSPVNFLTLCLLCIAAPAQSATHCPAMVLDKAKLKGLSERRHKTFKHCLACKGTQCELKSWPEEGKAFAYLCMENFCAARKIPRVAFTDNDRAGYGDIVFTYRINRKGRATDFKITEISGDLSEAQAQEFARTMYVRRRYIPIEIDGTTYELNNLRGASRVQASGGVRVVEP